jgi:RluA family pseudouridine synthase
MSTRQWTVTSEEEGITLLSFLKSRYKEAPSTKAIKRAIDSKFCTVHGRVETFSSHPLKQGAQVALDLSAFSQPKFSCSLSILYEDADLIIYNKPVGVVSESRSFHPFELVHRLDKETSGAIVLAKKPAVKEALSDFFAKRRVHKSYLALVDGVVGEDKGKMDNEIGQKGSYSGQTIYGVVETGKGRRAITCWSCLKRGGKASLLLCEPLTGRTHQIRVHLSSIGHPILGDFQYGKHFRCQIRPRRHLLHAYQLRFPHPTNENQEVQVTAPVPLDFQNVLDILITC